MKAEVLMSLPTFVLVHGGWGGEWCWRELTAVLDSRGVEWRSLDLPSSRTSASPDTALAHDAQAVADAARDAGPVVLVGHSYGGCVISEAAPLINELRGLVYVAALVPELGESATEASRVLKVRTKLDDAITLDGEFLRLRREVAGEALYQDCGEQLTQWALEQLSTQTLASFRSSRTAPDQAVPRRYIACSEDNAIDPSTQAIMASRCSEEVVLASGHSPFFSHPNTLADLITAPLS